MPKEELTAGSGPETAPPATPQPGSLPTPETIERPQFRGRLYEPPGEVAVGNRWPAVVLLPAPGDDQETPEALLADLSRRPIIALLITLDDDLAYPESLAILPAALEFLNSRPTIDSDRIGVLGAGLAADLVLRSASTDPQVRSILALAPYLSARFVRSGLGAKLRREPGYANFLTQTDSLSALRQLSQRQLRLAFCAKDSPIDLRRAWPELAALGFEEGGALFTFADVRLREVLTAPSAIQFVCEWFERTL